MSEENEKIKKNEVLVMLSGGRDSFLTTCKMIAKGYHVHLVTYDNGCITGTDNVEILYQRLVDRFGEKRVSVVGVCPIAQNIKNFLSKIIYEESIEICKKYPHLIINQAQCLVCHSVMYLHAIAYCKVHGITNIAEGAREQQMFFVELPEMKKRYMDLCKKYGIAHLQTLNTEVRLVSIIRCHSSGAMSCNNPTYDMPALLMTMSGIMELSLRILNISFTLSNCATSFTKLIKGAPSSLRMSSRECNSSLFFEQFIMTLYPFLAYKMAVSRPIPLDEPVINTVFDIVDNLRI